MNRKNKKGKVVTPVGVIYTDSNLEVALLKSLDWNRVFSIYRHFPIEYILHSRKKVFLVDFLITYKDGSKEMIEVKGAHLLHLVSTKEKFRYAHSYCIKNNIKWRVYP